MAAKVETLRVTTQVAPRPRRFVKRAGEAMKRWVQKGQLGSSTLEMRTYTGAR